MRSAVYDVLPARVRRSLKTFGQDLNLARRRRKFTVASMAERLAVSKSTYLRAEKGDPSVSLGVYAMAIFVLGFKDVFASVIDATRDDHGFLFDVERLPKRVRSKKREGES